MYRTLDHLECDKKNVLVRFDLNVPIKDGCITDDTRIVRVLPTVRSLLQKGGRVVMVAHFGRPKGKVCPELSLKVVAEHMTKLLDEEVCFVEHSLESENVRSSLDSSSKRLFLLENIRFYEDEEKNDPNFAQKLAKCGDVFVNDAFSAAHRAHASTVGVTEYLESYAGPTLMDEVTYLTAALDNPKKPLLVIVGGSKVSTKLHVLKHVIEKADYLLIGGAMANTLLWAKGYPIGKSLYEEDLKEEALSLFNAMEGKCDLILPKDVVVAGELKAHADTQVKSIQDVAEDDMILDVGPQTRAYNRDLVSQCQSVLWNGPLGAFEFPPFHEGTCDLAKHIATLSREKKIMAVAGGGDTVSALEMAGVTTSLNYVSTAGGAFLEWMEGRSLPGVAALKKD